MSIEFYQDWKELLTLLNANPVKYVFAGDFTSRDPFQRQVTMNFILRCVKEAIAGFVGCGLAATVAVTVSAQPVPEAAATLPPMAEQALNVLEASPRHGEWVRVPVPGSDAPVQSFVAYPERSDKAPTVIVIHEIFGLTDWVRSVADALAAEGFIAIAPDLLSGHGPDGGGSDSVRPDQVRQLVRNLTDDEVNMRLDAVRQWLRDQPAATDKLGVVGFCWGGSRSFAYACHQGELDAAVVYYGTAPDDAAQLARIQAPVLGLYGGDDARVTSTVDRTREQMSEHGKRYEVEVYDGAGHGFLRQRGAERPANAEAAEAAWQRTIAYFNRHLEVNP